MTMTAEPVVVSDASRALIAATMRRYVDKHPLAGAKLLARLDANVDRLDAYDACKRDELRSALTATARCEVCGRKLEDPDSVKRGIGPECLKDQEQADG